MRKKILSGIIYRHTCSNCKVTYYGKTFCHFYTRAVVHMGISNLTGKHLKNVKQSAISDHLLQCNCTINFDDFSILATDSNKFKLLLRESLLIKRDKPILNRTFKIRLIVSVGTLWLRWKFYLQYHMIVRFRFNIS